jgi:antitoxin (DNA-binding transcriptional repressor) of toxin-antitoxin stability system
MKTSLTSRTKKAHRAMTDGGRPSIGIRELKAKASAIIEDVKDRGVTYAGTKRGEVEALIMPVDAGERLLKHPMEDNAWDAWQALLTLLSKESSKKTGSAVAEIEQMRR